MGTMQKILQCCGKKAENSSMLFVQGRKIFHSAGYTRQNILPCCGKRQKILDVLGTRQKILDVLGTRQKILPQKVYNAENSSMLWINGRKFFHVVGKKVDNC